MLNGTLYSKSASIDFSLQLRFPACCIRFEVDCRTNLCNSLKCRLYSVIFCMNTETVLELSQSDRHLSSHFLFISTAKSFVPILILFKLLFGPQTDQAYGSVIVKFPRRVQ